MLNNREKLEEARKVIEVLDGAVKRIEGGETKENIKCMTHTLRLLLNNIELEKKQYKDNVVRLVQKNESNLMKNLIEIIGLENILDYVNFINFRENRNCRFIYKVENNKLIMMEEFKEENTAIKTELVDMNNVVSVNWSADEKILQVVLFEGEPVMINKKETEVFYLTAKGVEVYGD